MRRCERSDLEERYALAAERIRQIRKNPAVSAPFDAWFKDAAAFILKIDEVRELLSNGSWETLDEEQMRSINTELYAPILHEAYDTSWGNPEYSVRMLGEECGRVLCFLYAELMGLTAYVFEGKTEAVTVHMELFIEIYNRFEESETPSYREIRQILYWFESDYCDLFAAGRVLQEIEPADNIARRIVMGSSSDPEASDPDQGMKDLRYLYRYGEYITDRERALAAAMASMKQEEIGAKASVLAGACCREMSGGKEPAKGSTVSLWYRIGSERLVRATAAQLQKMGLEIVLFRHAVCVVNRRGMAIEGYAGADPCPQFRYDHREDAALYLDRKFADRRLGVIKSTYEDSRQMAGNYAGAVLIETDPAAPLFNTAAITSAPQSNEAPTTAGQLSFKECPAEYRFSNRQRELLAAMESAQEDLRKTYLPGAGIRISGNVQGFQAEEMS